MLPTAAVAHLTTCAVVASLTTLILQASPAQAQATIHNATVVSNTGGEASATFSIQNTINQSGLSINYTSGVTLFDTYIASNPIQSFDGQQEWFAPRDVTSSIITYDLGDIYSLDRIALWNEDGSGIQSMTVSTSTDASFAVETNVGTFAPTDNPRNADYSAQVLGLTTTNARYVRVSVTGPQAGATFNAVSMGEIAFSTSPAAAAVPEANAFTLFGCALPMIGAIAVLRRKK